jgi:hypothetical protein
MLAVCIPQNSTQAGIVLFDLQGRSGFGLLPGNENPTATGGIPGSGGELPGGIFFDDVSNLLTINVGWGTANGFTNLSGNATAMHIHQSTGFTTNGGVQVGLDSLGSPSYNNNAISGGFSGAVTLSAAQETALLSGLLYINVHTTANPGGEIRGNLVAVPEPSSVALVALVGVPVVIARMRARRKSLAS